MSGPGDDPRAYRMTDADGEAIEVWVDSGEVWLAVHGWEARLEPVQAMKLGGHINGAGQRTVAARRRKP